MKRSTYLVCTLAVPAAIVATAWSADDVILENPGIVAVFPGARNCTLTRFGLKIPGGKPGSLLVTMEPVLHYVDPEVGVYYNHLGGGSEEFGATVAQRVFTFAPAQQTSSTLTVEASDVYMDVTQRASLDADSPCLAMAYTFRARRDVQQCSWSSIAMLRFADLGYERFFQSYDVRKGVLAPVVRRMGEAQLTSVDLMHDWCVIRDPETTEGLLVLFPSLTGRAFLQHGGSYLSILGPYTEDKFIPEGERFETTIHLVAFRGDFRPALDEWARKLDFDPAPPLRSLVSPTGVRLAETDELLVWSDVPSRKILLEEPAPSDEADGVHISAAQGEYEPFQLVFRGKAEMPYTRMERIEIIFSELRDKDGGTIPSTNLSSAVAEFVNLRYPKGLGWSGPTPDTLMDTRTLACDPGKNTVLWVTAKVPLGTPAGIYGGTMAVFHGMGRRRQELMTIPLQVRVFGFALPDERHYTAWLHFNSRRGMDLLYKGKDTQAIWDRYVRNIVEHRICLRYVPLGMRFKDGSAELKTDNLKYLEDELKYRFVETKAPQLVCRAFGIGAGHKLMWTPFGEPEDVLKPLWRARYRKLAQVLGDFLRERGWQDRVIFELFDEPYDEHIPILAECIKMLKEEFPEIRVTYAAMWVDPRLYGLVNVWLTGGGYSHIPAQRRRAAGDTIWFGNNGEASVDRLAAHFRLTWWRYWLDGIAGSFHWTVGECNDWYRHGRWGRNRIATWLLPGEDGPINTIRWELTREGLEDIEYLRLLEHAIRNARAKGADALAEDGERVLSRVKQLVIRNGRFLSYNPDAKLLHEVRENVAVQIERMAPYLPPHVQ